VTRTSLPPVEVPYAQSQVNLARAMITDADLACANHLPGHELYGIERYLSVMAELALMDFVLRWKLDMPPLDKG